MIVRTALGIIYILVIIGCTQALNSVEIPKSLSQQHKEWHSQQHIPVQLPAFTLPIQPDYTINQYDDNACLKPSMSTKTTPMVGNGLVLTSIPGCYTIIYGPLSGLSFRLTCTHVPTSDYIVQTLFRHTSCFGPPVKSKKMRWSFFKGQCRHKQMLVSPLNYSHYPECKKVHRKEQGYSILWSKNANENKGDIGNHAEVVEKNNDNSTDDGASKNDTNSSDNQTNNSMQDTKTTALLNEGSEEDEGFVRRHRRRKPIKLHAQGQNKAKLQEEVNTEEIVETSNKSGLIREALQREAGNMGISMMRADYRITRYWYDECSEPRGGTDGLKKANMTGCYNFVDGSLLGHSFLLTCVASSESMAWTTYTDYDCQGSVFRTTKMKRTFFFGDCQQNSRIEPPLQSEDLPECDSFAVAPKRNADAIVLASRDIASKEAIADYYINAYNDDSCEEEKVGPSDGLKATAKDGCFDITQGSLKGSSMLLTCSHSPGAIVRTIYKEGQCDGVKIRERLMKWAFFNGSCEHKERVVPPMNFDHYPECKKLEHKRNVATESLSEDVHAEQVVSMGDAPDDGVVEEIKSNVDKENDDDTDQEIDDEDGEEEDKDHDEKFESTKKVVDTKVDAEVDQEAHGNSNEEAHEDAGEESEEETEEGPEEGTKNMPENQNIENQNVVHGLAKALGAIYELRSTR